MSYSQDTPSNAMIIGVIIVILIYVILGLNDPECGFARDVTTCRKVIEIEKQLNSSQSE